MIDPGQWDAAACIGQDVDVFYAHELLRGIPRANAVNRAKSICARCPITQRCLDYALANDRSGGSSYGSGIWGGLIGAERDRIRGRYRGSHNSRVSA